MEPRLTLRVDLAADQSIGPGKIRLLEAIEENGSISSAGRALGMSYRRAWLLVEAMNEGFSEKVVATKLGGTAGGGAQITPFGKEVMKRYREIEKAAMKATKTDIAYLVRALR